MMKMKIVRGFLHPRDLARKTDRRAVVLGETAHHVVVAPVTTYFARTGAVPPGHVLVNSKNCPVFSKTGFDVDGVLISIRDAVRVSKVSPWYNGSRHIGSLDIEKAPRILREIGLAIRDFPISDQAFE